MVFVNMGTDVNIYTKVSNIKKMDNRPEAIVNNHTDQETLLSRRKNKKIQIDIN